MRTCSYFFGWTSFSYYIVDKFRSIVVFFKHLQYFLFVLCLFILFKLIFRILYRILFGPLSLDSNPFNSLPFLLFVSLLLMPLFKSYLLSYFSISISFLHLFLYLFLLLDLYVGQLFLLLLSYLLLPFKFFHLSYLFLLLDL